MIRPARALATPDQPLVLFLDDIQWADPGSLFVLNALVRATDVDGLLILATFRDGLAADDPLEKLLAEWEEDSIELERLEVGALDAGAIERMLEHALDRPRDVVAPLARLVASKTGGRPLQIEEFLHHLHRQRVVHFEVGIGWTFDVESTLFRLPDEGLVCPSGCRATTTRYDLLCPSGSGAPMASSDREDEYGFLGPLPATAAVRRLTPETFEGGPAVGQPLPDFTLPDQHGRMVDLHIDRGGARAAVVFFRSAVW